MPEILPEKGRSADQNTPPEEAENVSAILHSHLSEATSLYQKANPVAAPKHSYLSTAIEGVASLVVKDEKMREEVGHYGSEFLKTGSLFARGKFGFAATVLAYGFDKTCREDSSRENVADFFLGATKGVAVKSLFGAVSRSYSFAPTKGVLMGIVSRDADVVFDRETFSDPSKTMARLKAETINPQAWLFDAAVFGVAEGAFFGVNKAMGGRLVKNPLASGMVMGGSFGTVNGGSAEIMRQKAEGQEIDWSKVIFRGALEGGVGALGAGAGIKGSDPRLHARIDKALGNPGEKVIQAAGRFALGRQFQAREFVLVDGKAQLDKFTAKHEADATVNVREVSSFLGFERLGKTKSLFIQRLGEGPPGIRPGADKADSIVTCFPETLAPAHRAKHLFPNAKGPVWLEAGEQGRLKLATGKTPWEHRNYNPIGKIARLDGHQITMNVMGPLEIGNVHNPESPQYKTAWENFGKDLERAKKLGADAVSTDVWWGAVEPKPGQFVWNYYDVMSSKIAAQNLKWVPILSLHECGGNVGDTANVPIPMWIWSKVQASTGSSNPDVGKFKSEQGKVSSEYVDFWATKHALPFYRNVMTEFQNHFAGKAPIIAEINVSLGPAGELRFPSYNYHDNGSGWPTRGALQAYSELARQSWRQYAVEKYGSEEAVKQAWGEKYGAAIEPPKSAEEFYASGDYRNTQYGKDFFDWYSKSLQSHGDQVLSTALDVFGSKGAAFAGIDIGAKIPGVHWRMGEIVDGKVVLHGREAELSAGLISTGKDDWNDASGNGYRPILSVFKNLQLKSPFSRVVPHFTALELPDGQDGAIARSLPHTLATWVGKEANQQGLKIKGENALAGTLYDKAAWERMASLLKGWGDKPGDGHYDGLTFLRMNDVLASEVAQQQFAAILARVRPASPEEAKVAQ
ncbi:MAG: family 14 glycosylhydrolase [Candidatus Melainabacteria bacterium]|nr:family 14 glycosylhydrolase [Candidatus Melainabacteria bacterium]